MKDHTRFTHAEVRGIQRQIFLLEHVLRLTPGRRDRRRLKRQIRELRTASHLAAGWVSVLKAGVL